MGQTPDKRRNGRSPRAVAALAVMALLTGCGGSDGPEPVGSVPDYEAALADAPPPLAAVYEQGNEVLEGGTEAFEARLAELEGYPVIVNRWASWCGPCRFEFPAFQRLSAKFGERIAFLGVDSQDSPEAAETFLADHQVPYPSYSDPKNEIAGLMKATAGFPMTAFYDRDGEQVYLKFGPYADDAGLEADIRRYALSG